MNLVMKNDKKEYWEIGRQAVADGLVTKAELNIIARVGHRKEWAWGRHLRDLKEIIEDRRRYRESISGSSQEEC